MVLGLLGKYCSRKWSLYFCTKLSWLRFFLNILSFIWSKNLTLPLRWQVSTAAGLMNGLPFKGGCTCISSVHLLPALWKLWWELFSSWHALGLFSNKSKFCFTVLYCIQMSLCSDEACGQQNDELTVSATSSMLPGKVTCSRPAAWPGKARGLLSCVPETWRNIGRQFFRSLHKEVTIVPRK